MPDLADAVPASIAGETSPAKRPAGTTKRSPTAMTKTTRTGEAVAFVSKKPPVQQPIGESSPSAIALDDLVFRDGAGEQVDDALATGRSAAAAHVQWKPCQTPKLPPYPREPRLPTNLQTIFEDRRLVAPIASDDAGSIRALSSEALSMQIALDHAPVADTPLTHRVLSDLLEDVNACVDGSESNRILDRIDDVQWTPAVKTNASSKIRRRSLVKYDEIALQTVVPPAPAPSTEDSSADYQELAFSWPAWLSAVLACGGACQRRPGDSQRRARAMHQLDGAELQRKLLVSGGGDDRPDPDDL